MDAFGKDRMPALPTNDLRKTKAAYVQEALKTMNEATDGSELLSSGISTRKPWRCGWNLPQGQPLCPGNLPSLLWLLARYG